MQFALPRRIDRRIRFLAIGLAAIVGILAYGNWRDLEKTSAAVNHSRLVIERVNDLLSALKDAETGQRGYLLAGDLRFLAPYNAVVAAIPGKAKDLQKAVFNDELQAQRATEIGSLTGKKLAEESATIALFAVMGSEIALNRIRTGDGARLMDEIRRVSAEMTNHEYQHLGPNTSRSERAVFFSLLVIVIGLAGMVLILIVLDRAVERTVAVRDDLTRRLEEARLRLHTTLRSIGDGVITTDVRGSVTFLNPIAENLTGWTDREAAGRPVEEIFPILNETTRAVVENPVVKVLRTGQIQGLANHTVLVNKNGDEVAIDDSGAPIRGGTDEILGVVLVFRDVSERRKTELQLEHWYQLFLQAGFGIAVIGSDNVITDANQGFAAMHGYTREEIRGMKVTELMADEGAREVDYLLGENPMVLESTHRRKDGSRFPVMTDITTLPSISGKAVRVAYVSDITTRKEAQNREARINDRFRGAAEAVGDIIWTNNSAGEMQGTQEAWGRFTGQTQDEYQGYGWAKAIHPDDAQPTLEAWRKAVDDKKKFVFEHRVRRQDGEYRIFTIRAVPIFEENGSIREWVGVHADLTDEKRLEESVRDSEERFRGLAAALPQMVWSSGPDGEIQYANSLWDEYAGERVSDVPRGPWTSLLHPQDAETYLDQWKASLAGGEKFQGHCRLKRLSDGSYRWFLCRSVPVRAADGRIIRWLGVCTDIDDQMRDAENLKRANEALRATNADLEQFAYAASHDLQEPLRMVSLYTQLLREDYGANFDESARSYIDLAVNGAQRMERLLQDLLEYSRVAAAPESEPEVADASPALATALENLHSLVASTNARIHAGPLPPVCIPAVHLVQVFQNIIGNALKYRSERIPEVEIAADRKHNLIEFSIRDNGIGIETQYLGQIFGVFKRLHGKEYEGTGIGLALCQRIVERNGGKIWVESDSKGSTFFFTLQAA